MLISMVLKNGHGRHRYYKNRTRRIKMESSNNSRITREGSSVLLDINNGERLVFARLSPNASLKIGKSNLLLNPIIGCPFGSLFQVQNGKDGAFLSRILPSRDDEQGDNVQGEENVTGEVVKDNRAIVDNNTAQTLTGDDIDEMRRQGVTGDQIVEALIANSATFDKKTSFSQEKYRLRKQKKYAPRVLVRRPFARSICDTYFKKHPAKIGCLRSDSLSLLLAMANVTAFSDVLVVDMVGGLVTGAVAERLGGTGYVCNTHLDMTPYQMDIVRIFNFSDDICKRIVRCCLNDLCPDQNGSHIQVQNLSSDLTDRSDVMEEEILEENKASVDASRNTTTLDSKICKSIKPGDVAPQELVNSWKEKGFSSLIIVAPEGDVWSIMQKLLPHVSYSASFSVYHQYLQPLATCMHKLQKEKLAIGMQISEPWLREYQVLPSRTHPHMQMSAFGGYILSGTKICTSNVQ